MEKNNKYVGGMRKKMVVKLIIFVKRSGTLFLLVQILAIVANISSENLEDWSFRARFHVNGNQTWVSRS